MLDILAITGPIYLAIASGFLFTRLEVFAKGELRTLGKFVLHLAIPALLFKSLAERRLEEIFNISYLLAYLLGSLAILAFGYLWSRRIEGLEHTPSTFHAMGMACSNSGFIGYPILMLSLAPVAGVSLALNMMVENLVILPLLLVMVEHRTDKPGQWYRVLGRSLWHLAKNPMILALISGCAVAVSGVPLPEWIARTVGMFALASGSLALFVIGGSLIKLPVHGLGRKVAPIVIGKLILHPLAVFAAILVIHATGMPAMDPSLRTAAVIMAAVPMLSIYTILAQVHGEEACTAAAMLVTTVTSFFTLSGLLWLLRFIPV